MEYENLKADNLEGILVLTINRPKALNALNQKTMIELDTFFSEGYQEYEGLKGVILTGSGEKAFVAGADIKEFLALDKGSGGDLSRKGQQIFSRIENMPVPVIAAIDGFT
ncbi:MAG: enoyl-CoA hydratase, partial [Saprospiraceae bacterium]|nr:enoyl-CoA hydratase [Saprospiraceae bacterium]